MNPLLTISATKLAEKIRNKEVTSLEVVEAHIQQIKKVNNSLNAVVKTRFDLAREEAKQEKSYETELTNLKAELEKVKAALVASEQRNSELDSELQKTNDALRQSKLEDETKSVDSPDTVSTGIKIEPPAVEKLDEEAALEDGWDEDW